MPRESNSAYDALFRRFYPRLFFYAQKIVGEDDAEDVVEEVFADLWRRKDEVEFGEKVQAFLYRAVYTRCLNVLRRRNVTTRHLIWADELNEKRLEMLSYSNSEGPFHRLANEDLHRILKQAIDELPEKCREVFRMSYLQDMHNEEIATTLELSVRTVEAHIYRALKYLRARLKNVD